MNTPNVKRNVLENPNIPLTFLTLSTNALLAVMQPPNAGNEPSREAASA